MAIGTGQSSYNNNSLFLFYTDDMLSESIRSEEGVTADTPFILALDDIKERNFDNIVVYCTQEIGRGKY